jgi:hypothetical protein
MATFNYVVFGNIGDDIFITELGKTYPDYIDYLNSIFGDSTFSSTFADNNVDADSSFNLSFVIEAVDIDKIKGYQIIGNLYDIGISLKKNFYFTPFALIQQDNKLYFYNSNFELKRTLVFDSITQIQDVCFTTQNFDIVLVGNDRLIKTNINGDVIGVNKNNLNGLISTGYTDRAFYGINPRAFFKNGVNGFNVDLQTLTVEVSACNSEGSVVYNNGLKTLEGSKGIVLTESIGAFLSGENEIGFTDFNNNTTIKALSTNSKIWDINVHKENLYIQVDNKLKVFNSSRELLSSFTLSTSAVSGCKIDFMSEDYNVIPVCFSRDINGSLLADKIINNNTLSGYELQTFNLGISSVNTNDTSLFVNPYNLYSAENIYKNYEDKLSLIAVVDSLNTIQNKERLWNTSTSVWNSLSTGYYTYAYDGVSTNIQNNSVITVLDNIVNGENYININFDFITGRVKVFVNGKQTNILSLYPNIKTQRKILKNNFYIGNVSYTNKSITDYDLSQEYLAKNLKIKNLKVYNRSLYDDFIKFLYLQNVKIDDVNYDISAGVRNNIETVNRFYSYSIPGALSDKIKIYIKGLSKDVDREKLKLLLEEKLSKNSPINTPVSIDDIDLDLTINE